MTERQRERKRERKKGGYNPVNANAAPEPQALSPLPASNPFGQNVPDLGGCQDVHHRLVALIYGKMLWDLHLSAYARVPSRGLSHCLPELFLPVLLLAAVAEEVLPRLGHCPSTLLACVVISVARPFQVDSSGRMPWPESAEHGSQQLYACHRDRSLGPCLALESVPEVLAALVGLTLSLSCWSSLGDSSSPIQGRCLWPLYHCASTCVSGQVYLRVCFFFPGMLECPGIQWILGAMRWARRPLALLLIHLPSRCLGPGSRCAVCRIAACESLNTATVFTPCFSNVSLFSITTSNTSLIGHSSVLEPSISPVPRKLQRDLHWFQWLNTAVAPTLPSSERDPSVHHIQTPAPMLASFYLAQRCVAHLAAVVSSSMVVLTTSSSPRAD